MNKKNIPIFIILILLLILGYFIYVKVDEYNYKQKIIKDIKDSYSEYVKVINDKKIYEKTFDNYKEVGVIYKDTVVPLSNKNVVGEDDIYYNIRNTDYYISYTDLEKSNNNYNSIYDKYLVTKSIKTKSTNLYKDDELMITLNKEMELDVLASFDDKYYVKYLDDLYYIKDSYEIIDKNIDYLKSISVLNITDGVLNEKIDEIIKYLKANNYDFISIDDFKLWVNGNISLENNKVLVISNKNFDDYMDIIYNNFDDINFISGDSKINILDKNYYKYDIYNYTSISRIKDMLNGIREIKNNKQGIAVLNYHFFYDSSIGESCNESICLDVSNFRKQLDYLKDNGYKTLKMSEFNDWMDNKINLPDKSVLITIDDGAMGTSKINGNKLIPILEEYKMNATLFLITGWWDKENYESGYLEIQSHGNELHHSNFCINDKCGKKGLLLSKEELKEDLNLSISRVDNNISFCYPFYAKNSVMVDAIKEVGFKLAFVGGNKKSYQSNDKYSVPRYVVYKNTSINDFINMVK